MLANKLLACSSFLGVEICYEEEEGTLKLILVVGLIERRGVRTAGKRLLKLDLQMK